MTEGSLDGISQQLKDIKGRLKGIDQKIGIQNSRVSKNEKEIALVRQRHDIESKYNSAIETWSRKKMIATGSVAYVLLRTVELLIQNKFM